jgi:hypothetical protein
MIKIDWKGKIGYGDIVSPICYAHNVSHKLGVDVALNFRWEFDRVTKIDNRDPETLWQRATTIFNLCDKQNTSVHLYHSFNDPLDINHTNYDWDVVGNDKLHNYWYPKKANVPDSNLIVVNSTLNNLMTLKQYGKDWKDPVASNWQRVVDALSKKYKVKVVDYTTPIDDMLAMLRVAKGFVGYHGTAAWVAKFMHTPSLLFSTGSLTRNAFPYAVIEKDIQKLPMWLDRIEGAFNLSSDRIIHTQEAYKTYMPSEAFKNHLHHEKI